ncbi:MAG TPA: hypothetical protein VFA71_00240 [Terriglobales bacterium]|nr:hypothetical protein [Terriglobales bacterium]
MSRIANLQTLCFVSAMALLSMSALRAAAQEGTTLKPPPPSAIVASQAPLPVQIQAAKKVFISNAGGELRDWFTGGPNRHYDQFYAAMKNWGRYELVTTPADADLIFEIRATGLYLSEAEEIPKFELAIYEPKTHVVLWALAERLDLALLKGHRDENFNRAMDRLMQRVKQLVEQGHDQATPSSS